MPSAEKMIASIRLSGCGEGLQALQNLAKCACKQAVMDKIHQNRIALALDELFANIHEHGYRNRGGEVECSARWLESEAPLCRLEIMLRDFAPVIDDIKKFHGVDPLTLKEHPVAGGLGMRLIYATTEKFEHAPLADGNQWRLLFNIATEKEDEE